MMAELEDWVVAHGGSIDGVARIALEMICVRHMNAAVHWRAPFPLLCWGQALFDCQLLNR